MHDFQKHAAEALPTLRSRLRAGGYKVVRMKAKAPLQTIAQYDAGSGCLACISFGRPAERNRSTILPEVRFGFNPLKWGI
jgi:hypothetical protein